MSELQDVPKKKFVLQIDPLLGKGDTGDKGDKGDTTIATLVNSSDITHDGAESTGIKVDVLLDQLLFITLGISGFRPTPDVSIFEKGISISSMNIVWVLNKTPLTQVLSAPNLTPPPLVPADRSATLPFSPSNTVDFAISLTVTDTAGPQVGTLDIDFGNKVHYGKDVIPGVFNDAFILALPTNNLQQSRVRSFVATAGVNEFIWFAVASALGTPTFKSGGFLVSMTLAATISHTNASGSTENYDIWRTTNSNLGTLSIDVT